MGLKKNNSIIGIYGTHQVIQIDNYPLIITLVALSTANTGKYLILSTREKIAPVILIQNIVGLFLEFGSELANMTEPMVAAIQDKH